MEKEEMNEYTKLLKSKELEIIEICREFSSKTEFFDVVPELKINFEPK